MPALAAVQTLRAEVPENRDVLYLMAVCQRYLGRVVDALATLEHLEEIHPHYGRLFQERGHCYRSYYRCYVMFMDHWNSVLPGKILRVQHEELLQDLDGQVRRILDFAGLEFEAACLEFYKTERSVRTASSEQVRQPIYKEGTEQWRHFEPWLGPLKEALGAPGHHINFSS